MDTLKISLDSFKKTNWSQSETENVEVATDFVQNLMNDHDFTHILNTYGENPYVQHSRGIPDGMNGLVDYISSFTKRYPEYTYDVKHIYADGDFVTFHSHATLKKKDRGNDKKGFNIIDTWRIVDGQIVEHWDSIQALDSPMRLFVWLNGGKIRNSNGLF